MLERFTCSLNEQMTYVHQRQNIVWDMVCVLYLPVVNLKSETNIMNITFKI